MNPESSARATRISRWQLLYTTIAATVRDDVGENPRPTCVERGADADLFAVTPPVTCRC